jgi:hypothetical protein
VGWPGRPARRTAGGTLGTLGTLPAGRPAWPGEHAWPFPPPGVMGQAQAARRLGSQKARTPYGCVRAFAGSGSCQKLDGGN